MGKKSEPDVLSFEDALSELESVVAQLEAGQLSLEGSLKLYQRGQHLSQRCNALLDAAQAQIESEPPLQKDE